MTGTFLLLRFALRRDRIVIPVWVLSIAAMVLLTGSSLRQLYPTQADRQAFAVGMGDNPAVVAIRGPARGLTSMGGELAWQVGWFAMVAAALMSLLLVVRHTRGDEESGRTELVLSAPTGRFAQLGAAVTVVAGANLVVSLAVAAVSIALGLPAGGSLLLGTSIGSVGLVFAAVAAVTAQLSETARTASGLAGAVLGVAYLLRAIGDVGDEAISWLSPIGWAQAARPYAGGRLWPLGIAVVASAAVLGGACTLLARRDLGAGLIQQHSGPAEASRPLRRPIGFALHLQRGSFLAWTSGLLVIGLAYGALGQNVKDLLETSSKLEEFFARTSGASLVDSFFATACLVLALMGTGFTIQAVLRLRVEEVAGRAEPVLATALSRSWWAASHLVVALVGTALMLAVAGAATGIAYALRGAGIDEVPRLAAAALAQAPAAWLLGSLALVLFGLAPRAAAVAWAPLAFCVVAGLMGPLLGLPDWVTDISPYNYLPQLPAERFAALPLIAVTAVAAALCAVGLAGFRRRDVA